MEDSEFSHPDLEMLLENYGNNICSDCQEKNPRWSSVNNGVIICSKCARKHLNFKNGISIIKSLEADLWNDDEVNYIRKGGNMRFNNLMTEYNIPINKDTIEFKYQTKIADYYRKLLSNEVKGIIKNVSKPSLEEGLLKIDSNLNNNKNYNNEFNYNSNTNNYIIQENSLGHSWSNVITSMGKVFNNIGSQIKSKMKDYKIDEKINKANDYLIDKKDKIANSEIFQNMKNKAENGIQIIKEKASELYKNEQQNDNLDENKSSDLSENELLNKEKI